MSIQLNLNTSGNPGTFPVEWVIDNGHRYTGVAESPARMIIHATHPEPSPYGSHIEWHGQILSYLLVPPDGYVGEVAGPPCDMHPPALHFGTLAEGRPHWDGTYLRHPDGRRYVSRRITGFLDYKIFLDGGPSALRPLLQQSQDLQARGRRMFPHIVKITDFNPAAYGDRYWQEIPAYFALNAEYDQEVDVAVLADAGYRGWSLSQCQDFWARWNAVTAPITNKWISLTNEWDHGGNLVGVPSDYARPNDPLVSQGSAVSDAPPPRPGWGRREFHVQKEWPKIGLCEDMYFNRLGVDADGRQWGPVLPTDLSEGPRFDEVNPLTTEWISACLAYQSLAFGDGLTFHCEDGKWGRLLRPRQAACCTTAMTILAEAER